MSKIGDRIKRLRQSRGMTQEELGAILGVSKSTVQKYESGKVPLSVDKIRILCRVFKEYPRMFIYDDEEFVRDVFGIVGPINPDSIPKDFAYLRYIEQNLEKDVIAILYASIRLSPDDRKKVLQYARLLYGFYEG